MLVVAAPHSKCIGPGRDCDLDAGPVARSLVKKARAAGIKTIGCFANQPRRDVDNNRDGSENSDFRLSLDKVLRQPGLFLEIHSHPNVPRFLGKQLTIFNLGRNSTIARELYAFLNDPSVGIQHGEPVMSIQKKYRGLMLEFNEGNGATKLDHEPLIDKIILFAQSKKPAPMFGGLPKSPKFWCIVLVVLVLLYILFFTSAEFYQCITHPKCV